MKNALVTITAAFLFCSTLMAQDTELSRTSLRGLSGVKVRVESLSQDAEKDGLSKDQIQTDVELRLRMAGIKVLTLEQSLAMPGTPMLVVGLSTFKRQQTYSYYLDTCLYQRVSLNRDPQVSVLAITWGVGSVGTVGSDNLGYVRNSIKDRVDTFINAWLSVNPK